MVSLHNRNLPPARSDFKMNEEEYASISNAIQTLTEADPVNVRWLGLPMNSIWSSVRVAGDSSKMLEN